MQKISVLFVGTSAARRSAAEQVLAARGYDVSVEAPLAGNEAMAAVGSHDLIAFDAVHGGATEDGRFIVVCGRCSADCPTHSRARVSDMETLPDAVLDILECRESKALANAGNAHSLAELHELVARLPGVVFRCGLDAQGTVTFMNERIPDLCGYRLAHFVGHSSERLLALVHPSDRRRVMTALQRGTRSGRPFELEHRIICASGDERWLWHRGCVYSDNNGTPRLESFVADITTRKYEAQQLAWLANHDALTGVANRGLFMEQLDKSLRRADRRAETVACLFLDLDRFKHVNDSLGHASGDELLRQVSERLMRCVRGNDMVGRLGGDEFAILLDGIGEPGDASAAAKKILEELTKPFFVRDRRLNVSASIGISCYPGDANDRASLLRNADAAMYNVKSGGRCGFRFYSTELSSRVFEAFALGNGLRAALESGGLRAGYQPRVDLRSGRICALEVTAHWDGEESGKLSPARFRALAEDTGLANRLDEWMLREACRQLIAWDKAGLPAMRLAVNLSVQQFRDRDYTALVETVLRETGLQPGRLELDVAENIIMQDRAASAEMLHKLKQLGVSLALDDFGAGSSSLHLLRDFPLDCLKIDTSFVRDAPDEEGDAAIVEAIVMLARRLDLRVVAKGIETEAQGRFMRSRGCDEGQGFPFRGPLPETEIRQSLDRWMH